MIKKNIALSMATGAQTARRRKRNDAREYYKKVTGKNEM